MRFNIEKYLYERADELAFLTLKEDASFPIKAYSLPKEGLEIPLLNEELVKGIKEGNLEKEINMLSFINGMIFITGIDSKFKNNEEYKKILYAFDENIENYIGSLGVNEGNKKELLKSLIYFKALITLNDKNLNGLYNYALVCQDIAQIHNKNQCEDEMNDFLLEAVNTLEYITEIYPEFALSYYQLGYHYHNLKQYVKTKMTWDEALKLGVEEDVREEILAELNKIEYKIDYEIGYNNILQGEIQIGLDKLLPLVEEYSDWWNLLFFVGLAYRQLGNTSEAMRYFEKILILNPKQIDSLVEIGLCYATNGDFDKAIEYFIKALEIKEDSEIICNIGMAYLNKGNYEMAKNYIEKAYSLNPDDEITILCMNELRKNQL